MMTQFSLWKYSQTIFELTPKTYLKSIITTEEQNSGD